MFYGNPLASAACAFEATFPSRKIVLAPEATDETDWIFDWVEDKDRTVTLSGNVTLLR